MAERVFELAAAGLNGYEMARQLGRPRSTVADVLRRCRRRAAWGTTRGE
jgi:IS30 family transposase